MHSIVVGMWKEGTKWGRIQGDLPGDSGAFEGLEAQLFKQPFHSLFP